MGYVSLRACVDDLERQGHLVRIAHEVDPELEVAEIQRRVYAAQGPALYFERARGTQFPLLSNLFGTISRARFVFRDALRGIERLFALKVDPTLALRAPLHHAPAAWTALHMLPRRVGSGPVFACEAALSAVPRIKSWPLDGGGFVTLPQV